MAIQAVFFDMGGTIENFWHTRELRLEATPGIQQKLQEAGIDLNINNEQLYEVVSGGLLRYHYWCLQSLEELPPERVWREYILAGYPVDRGGLAAIAEELMFYIENHYYHREMRPEMPSVLEAVRSMGFKIGLISNVCSRSQVPQLLESYGIRDYFETLVLSSEYGRRKPDPAIFHYAARKLNVPTSRCVHIGDRLSRDVLGARRAGYGMVIQIQHQYQGKEIDEGPAPDRVIDQMTELVDILRVNLKQSGRYVAKEEGVLHPVRAILFDAGDILYYRPQRGQKLKAFLKELDIHGVDTHKDEINEITDQAYLGLIDQDQYREAVLRIYGVRDAQQIECGKRILDEDDNHVQFFKGVRKTLEILKENGYLLGIVTDTAMPVYAKLSWFERGGFGNVWDSIISSKELGVRKPDPRIYQAALKQLRLNPTQAVFVGHKASELEGACSLGIRTIALNYDENAKADFYIESFSDLLNVPLIFVNNKEKWMNPSHG
ncbi:MAG: HAD family hydrolase [Omnitrophica WOR_2 bacterium]